MPKKSAILILISPIVIGQVFLIYNIVFASHGDNSFPVLDGRVSQTNYECSWNGVRDCPLDILTRDSINYQAYESRVWGTAEKIPGEEGRATVGFCLSNTLPMASPPAICGEAFRHPNMANPPVVYSYDETILAGFGDVNDYNYAAAHIRVEGARVINNISTEGRRIKIASFDVPTTSVEVGSQFTVSWTTFHSFGNVSLSPRGPVSRTGEDILVGANGSMTFTAGPGIGTAQFNLRAEYGPGHNGPPTGSPTYVDQPASVDIVNPPGPGAPGSFTLSSPGQCRDGGFDLTWTPSERATSYQIFERQWTTGSWTNRGAGVSPYRVDGPTLNTDYYYVVDAINGAGRTTSNTVFGGMCPGPAGPLVCNPSSQTVQIGHPATFVTAGGSSGNYRWRAPGGNPDDGDGLRFSTTYSSPDSPRTVTVRRGPDTASCNVNVTSQPPVGCEAPDTDCAQFVRQTVPLIMTAGRTYLVSVTMRNSGGTTWSCCTTSPFGSGINDSYGYKLATVTVAEEQAGIWGIVRIGVPPATIPPEGTIIREQEAVFNFTITAPPTPGFYDFQWKMIKEHFWRFDNRTDNVRVDVRPAGVQPTTSNVSVLIPDYCRTGPSATISWTYSDPSGSPQGAYQVQIDEEGSSFRNPEVDSGRITSDSRRYSSGPLRFGITYKARVRTWNSDDVPSAWQEVLPGGCSGTGCRSNGSWRTPNYAYPQVDFTWTPTNPPINRQVSFNSELTVFGGNPNGRRWDWLFGDGGSSDQQNPTHTYTQENRYYVTLTATDNANQSCTRTKGPLGVQKPIPIWKEIAPR